MKLWLISQAVNSNYDTYDSAVVAAETEDDARNTRPDGLSWEKRWYSSWVETPNDVTVVYVGEAASGVAPGVVLASFNAG